MDESGEGYCLIVKPFIGYIVEDSLSFEAFESNETVMKKILNTDFKQYCITVFFFMLMKLLDKNDFFSKILLKKALSKRYPECKIIEEKASESFPFDTIGIER